MGARDLSVEVREFVVSAMNADAALLTDTGGRAYGPSVPLNPVWPFIRTDLPVATPDADGCGGSASRYTFNVHGFAEGDDERPVGHLAAKIVAALDELSGPLAATPDAGVRDTLWLSTTLLSDPDRVNGWHAVVRISCLVSG